MSHIFPGRRTQQRRSKKRPRADLESDEEAETPRMRTVKTVGNHIYFNGVVDDRSVSELIHVIEHKNFELRMIASHELVDKITPSPLYLHINSDGGMVFSAMSAFDAIKRSKLPIYTIVDGRAFSAGSVIAMAGTRRFMTKHSYLMIHQLSSGVIGTYSNIKDEYENSSQMMEDIVNIYHKNTRISIKKKALRKLMMRDKYWRIDECIRYGLVDADWDDHDHNSTEVTMDNVIDLITRKKD